MKRIDTKGEEKERRGEKKRRKKNTAVLKRKEQVTEGKEHKRKISGVSGSEREMRQREEGRRRGEKVARSIVFREPRGLRNRT